MVTMVVLLRTSKVLRLEHCVLKLSVKILADSQWKGERTLPIRDTAVVLRLVIYLHLNSVMQVCWELDVTDDPLAVL